MDSGKFSFLGYRVSEIRCKIQDEFRTLSEPEIKNEIKIQNNFDTQAKLVEVVLDVTLRSDEAFYFQIKVKGGFQANNDMKDDLFKRMAKQNAPAILYPFVRSLIATYTAQANIPPIILPAVNFVDKTTNILESSIKSK